eukprot:snap_masked-scaffold_2-processed-gene-22.30-mRNA-1 protein AED:1.00 eAED:1.00 QI:0/-1/0/0/-1/1/1/0/274
MEGERTLRNGKLFSARNNSSNAEIQLTLVSQEASIVETEEHEVTNTTPGSIEEEKNETNNKTSEKNLENVDIDYSNLREENFQNKNEQNTPVSPHVAKIKEIFAKKRKMEMERNNIIMISSVEQLVNFMESNYPNCIEKVDSSEVGTEEEELVPSSIAHINQQEDGDRTEEDETQLESSSTESSSSEDVWEEFKEQNVFESDQYGASTRQIRTFWSRAETDALLGGMERYCEEKNKYAAIKNDPEFSKILKNRTNVQLKDKWRNIQIAKKRQTG